MSPNWQITDFREVVNQEKFLKTYNSSTRNDFSFWFEIRSSIHLAEIWKIHIDHQTFMLFFSGKATSFFLLQIWHLMKAKEWINRNVFFSRSSVALLKLKSLVRVWSATASCRSFSGDWYPCRTVNFQSQTWG